MSSAPFSCCHAGLLPSRHRVLSPNACFVASWCCCPLDDLIVLLPQPLVLGALSPLHMVDLLELEIRGLDLFPGKQEPLAIDIYPGGFRHLFHS